MHSVCDLASCISSPFWLGGVKVRLRMACATSCCVVYVTVDGVRCKWIDLLQIIKVVWNRMLCCYVSVVIKSECFIEWRFSPNFLLISMKSVVFSNAEVKMMWLMKARCGLLQCKYILHRNGELQCCSARQTDLWFSMKYYSWFW